MYLASVVTYSIFHENADNKNMKKSSHIQYMWCKPVLKAKAMI